MKRFVNVIAFMLFMVGIKAHGDTRDRYIVTRLDEPCKQV